MKPNSVYIVITTLLLLFVACKKDKPRAGAGSRIKTIDLYSPSVSSATSKITYSYTYNTNGNISTLNILPGISEHQYAYRDNYVDEYFRSNSGNLTLITT